MDKLITIMYHYVRDLKHSRYPKIKAMDLKQFEQQLDFFEEHFNIITMEEVIHAWNLEKRASLPEKALLLTFDDGYIDNYTNIFPILKKRHLQGSFFIPGKTINENKILNVNKIHFILASANKETLLNDIFHLLEDRRKEYNLPPIEQLYREYAKPFRYDDKDTIFIKRILQTGVNERLRNEIANILFDKYVGIPEENFSRELYMNRDQIHCMKEDGMFIGLHGYDHYWLGNLDEEKMRMDIDKAKEVLRDWIDPDCWVLNYPFGSYNEKVLSYIQENGCKLAMTSKVDVADIQKYSKYILPRLDCNAFPPKSNDYKKYLERD